MDVCDCLCPQPRLGGAGGAPLPGHLHRDIRAGGSHQPATGMSCRWKHKQAKPYCPPNPHPKPGMPSPTPSLGAKADTFYFTPSSPRHPVPAEPAAPCQSASPCGPSWPFPRGCWSSSSKKKKKKKRQNEALRWEMSRPAQCSEVASWHQRGHILPVLADGTGADTVLPSSRGQHPVPVLQARSGPPVPARGPRGRGSPPAGHHLQHRGTHLQPRASCWVGKALPTQPNPPKNLWITPKTRLPRGWAQPSWSSFSTSVIPQLPRARHLTCCCFIFTRKKNQDKRQFPPQPPT